MRERQTERVKRETDKSKTDREGGRLGERNREGYGKRVGSERKERERKLNKRGKEREGGWVG